VYKIAGFAIACGVLCLLYAADSPAPPPPLANCTTGTPATLAVRFGTPPLAVPINTYLPAFTILAFDSAGNPLRNIDITVLAPASGAGGTFNVYTDPATGAYTTTPNPISTTMNTGATCDGVSPLFIANGTVGTYQLNAAAGPLGMPIPMVNTPLAIPALIVPFNTTQIAHVGGAYLPLTVQVRDATLPGVGGIPVTFTTPPAAGASATFPNGSNTATVLSDGFGIARSPVLTANGINGYFQVTVSAPPTAITVGALVNGAGTVTTMRRDPTTPDPVLFGAPINFTATVQFNGFPGSGTTSGPASFPQPRGTVLLQSDGRTVGAAAVDDLSYRFGACATCTTLTLNFFLSAVDVPFGTHQLTATFQPSGGFDASISATVPQTVVPAFTLPTVIGAVQSMVGITGGDSEGWFCTLRSAAWVPVSTIAGTLPSVSLLPYGLFSYRIDTCAYAGLMFDPPPAGFHPVQQLVLQFSQALPPTAVFVAFGPTRGNATPHWYALPTQVDGATMRVTLGDGDPGDDDLTLNGIIAGKGAIAVSIDPAPIPATSIGTIAALTLLIGAALLGRFGRVVRPGKYHVKTHRRRDVSTRATRRDDRG
jgi:Bacterial Ig-like domain (group 3)